MNSEYEPGLKFDIQRTDDGFFEIRASRNFAAGEEALVSYHQDKPSLHQNFLAYGFVPDKVARASSHDFSRLYLAYLAF